MARPFLLTGRAMHLLSGHCTDGHHTNLHRYHHHTDRQSKQSMMPPFHRFTRKKLSAKIDTLLVCDSASLPCLDFIFTVPVNTPNTYSCVMFQLICPITVNRFNLLYLKCMTNG